MKATLLRWLLVTVIVSCPALADAIPYQSPGTIAPTVPIVAATTGNVIGYFYGSDAGDTDQVRMCNLTQGGCSAYAFSNHSTSVGSSFDFGSVIAGDVLAFELDNINTGAILSSDPILSDDGVNHAYITLYGGGFMGIPTGTFVGMEDLIRGDFDYNDDQLVFTNVAASAVPEPMSLLLLASVVVCLGIGFRRKFAQ